MRIILCFCTLCAPLQLDAVPLYHRAKGDNKTRRSSPHRQTMDLCVDVSVVSGGRGEIWPGQYSATVHAFGMRTVLRDHKVGARTARKQFMEKA